MEIVSDAHLDCNVVHVGRPEDALYLRTKVVDESGRDDPARSCEVVSHVLVKSVWQ